MTHSAIDPIAHITDPIIRFLDKVVPYDPADNSKPAINIPKSYFSPPSNWGKVQQPTHRPGEVGDFGASNISSGYPTYLPVNHQPGYPSQEQSSRRIYGTADDSYSLNYHKPGPYQGISSIGQPRNPAYEGVSGRSSHNLHVGSQRAFAGHPSLEQQPPQYGWRTQHSVSQPPTRR